jgi:hypothetical protein
MRVYLPGMRKEAAIVMVLAILGWCATPASASNVLAHWTFDEGAGQVAADSGPFGEDGRLGSTSGSDAADPSWTSGHDGRALSFTGAQYVAVPDSTAFEPAQVAVDAWVRRDGSPGNWRYVLAKGSVSCDRAAYGLYTGFSGGLAFYVSDTTHYTISPEVSKSLVWDDQWHHVVGSYDGARVQLFLDGAQVGTGTPASLAIAYGVGSKGVTIGMYRGSCDRAFAGDIDDVQLWNGPAPGPAVPLPIIPPVPGTPTQMGVGGGSDAPVPSAGSRSTPRGCLRVSLSRHTVPVRKRTRVVATVRRGTKRVAGVHVVVKGAGVSATGRTNHQGRAGIRVKAKTRGRLTVRVKGQQASCPATSVRAS